jgi:pimeloyl-ACP methyl ester carboxylesterase
VRFTKDHLPLGDVPENVWRHFAIHQFKKVDVGYTFHYDPKLMRRSKVDLLNPADLTEGLKKLNCPLALIAGGKSDLCTQDEIVALKKLRPDVRIHICPEAGHIPSLSDSDTQAFIGAFLSSANRNTPSLHSSAATKG